MKSNLLKKAALASMVGIFITPMTVNLTASADSNSNYGLHPVDKDNITSLQNEIDSNVQVNNNGNYVYSPDKIKSIVYSYNFDKINKNANTNYSKESFFEKANNSLSTTKVNVNQHQFHSLATYSGVNKTVDHWNYTRVYRNHSKTAKTAIQYSNVASNWGAAGGLSGAISLMGPYGLVAGVSLGATSAAESWYWSQFSNALNINNNSHGTKADVNKFDAKFTVNPQN